MPKLNIQENYNRLDELGTIRTNLVHVLYENTNYPPGQGNLFLSHISSNQCLGGIEKDIRTGLWAASIRIPYDEESDSDCKVICEGTRNDCIDTLWFEREQAHMGC